MKTTIRRRLLRPIILVLVLTYFIVCVATSLYVRNLLVGQAWRDNRQVLLQAGQQMDLVLQLSDMTARQVMTDDDMAGIIAETRDGPQSSRYITMSRADSVLREYLVLNPYISGISIISWDDMVFSDLGVFFADVLETRREAEWYEALVDGTQRSGISTVYSTATRSTMHDIVTMAYKYQIYGETPSPDNLLMIDIPVARFAEILEGYGGGQILVVNENGQTIVESTLLGATDVADIELSGEAVWLEDVVVIAEPMPTAGWTMYYAIPSSDFNRPITTLLLGLICLFILVLIVALLVLSRLISRIVQPVHTVTTTMQAAYNGNLDVHAAVQSGDEMEVLSDCFNKLLADLKAHISQIKREEATKKQMEIDLLMSQIHPHFIYNTLNSAVYMIEQEEPEQAIEVIYSLIGILQETVRFGSKEIFSTVDKELELLEAYCAIASVRYPGAFTLRVECDDALRAMPIPKVLVQPLAENAINHGILPSGRAGTIWVRVRQQGGWMLLEVEDDGVGVDDVRLSTAMRGETGDSHGVGLSNIHNRIQFLYNAAGFHFSVDPRSGGGTCVRIHLPIDRPVQPQPGTAHTLPEK